ncbi:hypothetical protein Cal6303_4445 [Calothrix sp. PCC 6303]|nr:hypothetical protein Cal6303_4445 [Calothrix sp. PCC 6303]
MRAGGSYWGDISLVHEGRSKKAEGRKAYKQSFLPKYDGRFIYAELY